MPQFEIEPTGQPARFVRARSATDAVRQSTEAGADDIEVGEAEAGSGWCAVRVNEAEWGRVRPRDRMRFRRD